jgi:simple sugar transport system permease protein
MFDIAFFTNWLAFTPTYAAPLLFAALGLIINERAGVMNLGAEGMMLVGALAAAATSFHSGNAWPGIAAAIAAGGVLAMLFGVVTVVLRANQVVAGLAVVALGAGITGLLGTPYSQKPIAVFSRIDLEPFAQLPLIGRLLFDQDALVYLAVPLVAAIWWLLFRADAGLRLRAVGESPQTADAAGVSVTRYRLAAVVAGGALCGLGGGYLALVSSQVWVEGVTGGRGWIAVALVIFSRWSPGRAVLGALLFGSIEALTPRIQATGSSISIFLLFMAPYLATLIVLTLTATRRGMAGAPAALGEPYVREDRR